ncbi:MAG: hybrid sensor histidine kinase/response regulator [Deltaproteobacteria bacterium]|nr:hybrid sensor histidine kinase/response regulator [Deltaproteobacteria bacterium]
MKPKLLLVDDLPANLLALESILESDYDLVQCTSGAAAIEAVGQHAFVVILLDVNMPIMDGLETARRIKRMPRGGAVPIIFITAASHDTDRVREAYKTGAVDFISKPVDRDVLCAKVKVFAEIHVTREQQLAREQQAREEAEHLAAHLENVGKLNEEFVASLDRELRAPLKTMRDTIRAVRSGAVAEPQRGHQLGAVEQHADAQLELIEEMLDMKSVAAGTLKLTPSKVNLATVVEGVVTTLRPRAIAASVRIEFSTDPELRPMSGDAERLAQIVRQLVTAAVRASSADGVVSVTLRRSGSQVQLTVEHRGPGIDAAMLPKIFDGFDDAEVPESLRGMALKLAIVRHLVELHRGTINVEGEGLGKGTRFVVELPAA